MYFKSKTIIVFILLNNFVLNAQNLIFIDQSQSVSEKYKEPSIKLKIEAVTKWFLNSDDNTAPKANLLGIKGFFIYENTVDGASWISEESCDCKELVPDSPKKAIKARQVKTSTYEKKVMDILDENLKSYEKKGTDIWGAVKRMSDYNAKNVFIVSDMIHCTKTDCINSIKDKSAAQKKGAADVAIALKKYSIVPKNLENTKIWIYYPIGSLESGKKDLMKEYWNSFFWKLNPSIIVGFID